MTYNKWLSRRWLLTLWAVIMVTLLLGYSLISKYSPEWLGTAIALFQLIIAAFLASESYLKPKMGKE